MDAVKHFLQAIDQAVIVLDGQFNVVEINEIALDFFGWQHEQVVHHPFPWICDYYRVQSPLLLQQILAHPVGMVKQQVQTHFLQQDGDLKLLEWAVSYLFDNDNNLQEVILLAKDASELVELKQQNHRLHSQLNVALQHMPGYVYWKDEQGNYRGCNQAYAELVGLRSFKEITGLSDRVLRSPMPLLNILAKQELRLVQNKSVTPEVLSLATAGRTLSLRCDSVPLVEQGRFVGILGVLNDVSDIEQVKDELRLAKSLMQQQEGMDKAELSLLRQDLASPLHEIMVNAKALLLNNLGNDNTDRLQGILDRGQEIMHRVSGSKQAVASFQHAKPEPFDLLDLLETRIQDIASRAAQKQLRLSLRYPVNQPRTVKAEREHLDELLVLLFNHSLKVTSQGYVHCQVSLHRQANDQANLIITLEDSGKGMAPSESEQIFVGESATGSLQKVQMIVQNLGGRFAIESKPLSGSRYIVELPIALLSDAHDSILSWRHANVDVPLVVIDDNQKRGAELAACLGLQHAGVFNSAQLTIAMPPEVKNAEVIVVVSPRGLDEVPLGKEFWGGTQFERSMCVAIIDPPANGQDLSANPPFADVMTYPILPANFNAKMISVWRTWSQKCRGRKVETRSIRMELVSKEDLQNEVRPRVLLVEDNLFSQKVTRMMLEGIGCKLDVVDSGYAAIESAQKYYDIIFLDIGLPDIDGIEVAKRIRQSSMGNRHVYICALTAHASDTERKQCFEVGMNGFLPKPARIEDFRKVIADALASSTAEQPMPLQAEV